MYGYLLSAFVRGILVALLLTTPTFILPDLSVEARQIAILVGVVGFVFVMFEYGSSHPGLVEFRFAPPFNRVRFLSLFFCLLALSAIFAHAREPGMTGLWFMLAGDVLGRTLDFTFSPVMLLVTVLADPSDTARVDLIRAAAGLSYGISLVMLAVFSIFIRVLDWPLANGSFNLWLNLPTFDPLAHRDVAGHLLRDSRVNILLGALLPFLVPVLAAGTNEVHDLRGVAAEQPLLWFIALWAFLPASLFMRGIAMARIAVLMREGEEEARRIAESERQAAMRSEPLGG